MKRALGVATLGFALLVLSVASESAPADQPIADSPSCHPATQSDTDHCRLDVVYDAKYKMWTTLDTSFHQSKAKKVHIVWTIKGDGPDGTKWHFEDDSLYVSANSDTTGFSEPCASENDEKCSGGANKHSKYRWFVNNPNQTTIKYELKLYSETGKLEPVVVKVLNKDSNGPVTVDPTIVIQG
jgi:hypothetical protein